MDEATKTISVTHKVPAERLSVWNALLLLKKASPDFLFDREISFFEVPLENDYSVDFRLVNGDKEAGPYLDVLFCLDGQEIQVLDPSFEKLDGTYIFHDHNAGLKFVVTLEGK